ncbi:hypothetical protein NJ7G_3062 [Natrinema sp. J7-2]|nr:hypothetical protein NJ7G_3062 [Natrinema sp. J7-2]
MVETGRRTHLIPAASVMSGSLAFPRDDLHICTPGRIDWV